MTEANIPAPIPTALNITNGDARGKPLTPAERSRAYRARKRGRKRNGVTRVTQTPVTSTVTKTVTSTPTRAVTDVPRAPQVTPRSAVTAPPQIASATLVIAALGLAGVGVIVNGWFARSLGSTEVAGWLFAAIGVAADVAALVLPCCAARLWRGRHRGAAAVGWAAWVLTLSFAITAGVGFASTNIADETPTRSSRTTPAIEMAQAALADAKAARDRECTRIGPVCRQREDVVVERQRSLDAALQSIERGADPQAGAAARLLVWATAGVLRPTADDLAMLRLLLLASLPQLGGVLLLVSRAR